MSTARPAGSASPRPRGVRATRLLLSGRLRRGWRRLRGDAWPILTGALAAGVAYGIAYWVVGHQIPVFAAIAAWVCLGFGAERHPRKVAELALGVTVGVALGEIVGTVIGSGPVQIAVVLAVAVAIARLIDGAAMLAMQAGVQAVVVVALPPTLGGDGVGRWVDALIGGAVALLVAALLPVDVRRRVRVLASSGLTEIALTLAEVAKGVRAGDEEIVDDALTRARGSQGVIDEWSTLVQGGLAATRFTPARLRHDGEMLRLQRAATLCDRAMRNTRVITRRAWSATQDMTSQEQIARLLQTIARSADDLAFALGSDSDPSGLRRQLLAVAAELDPPTFAGWPAQTLVVLMRSLVVDLLQLTGMSGEQARRELASLDAGGTDERQDPPTLIG
ncbi:FUSC family protein [Ruania halotolerans]|uniref:FUSC family protein n=1 Tax=Ruania halotolerans TaxID=2897773 RepID=UPI001E38EAC7|nr:FUSC family protein [Ruania halotolerans]UFU05919.1 FUSC family protein [Ruania halotolerans]